MLQLLNWQITRNSIIYEFKENETRQNKTNPSIQNKPKTKPHQQPDTITRTTTKKDWLISHVLKRLFVKSNFCLTRGSRSLKA